MKHYREKLKIDTIITAVTAAILAAAFILSLLNEFGPTQFFTPAAGDSHWHSRWNGFICGASVGLLGMMVFFSACSTYSLVAVSFTSVGNGAWACTNLIPYFSAASL